MDRSLEILALKLAQALLESAQWQALAEKLEKELKEIRNGNTDTESQTD